MSDLTARNFQDPLLCALGTLTGFQAGVPISGEDTYDLVMTHMGISDIGAHGIEKSSGQPMVQRWIQWANKNLRGTGLTELQGRGQWMLTAAGVKESQRLTGGMPVMTQVVDTLVTGAVPNLVQIQSRGPLDDPYILHLVLEQSGCLGNYTNHGLAECLSCPVSLECRHKQYANYALAAATFGAADAQAAALKAAMAAQANKAPSVGVATPAGSVTPPKPAAVAKHDMSKAERILAFEETMCSFCGNPIAKNEKCLWLDDLDSGESLMVHISCSGAP